MNNRNFISTKGMSREEWLSWRDQGIGGSDAAVLLGKNPYQTLVGLYLDKIGEKKPIFTEEHLATMQEGTDYEPRIRSMYSLATKQTVEEIEGMIFSDRYNYMFANIDGAVVNNKISNSVWWDTLNQQLTTDKILECKYSKRGGPWTDPAGDRIIPEYYMIQCQWYMGITKTNFCDLTVLIGAPGSKGKMSLEIFPLRFDEALFEKCCHAATYFWNRVESRTPPDAASEQDCIDLYGTSTSKGKTITVPDWKSIDIIKGIKDLEAELKMLKTKVDDSKEYTKSLFVNNAELLVDSIGTPLASISTRKGAKRVDVNLLKENYPDVADSVLRQGSDFRVLKVIATHD